MIHAKWMRLLIVVVFLIVGGVGLRLYNQVDKPQLVNTGGRTFENHAG